MAKSTLLLSVISSIIRIFLGYKQEDIWKIKGWKFIVCVPLVSIIGIVGAKLSSGAAYGDASGVRMYGTVLLTAVFIPLIALLFRADIKEFYGFNGMSLWLSLTLTKSACIINGCCYGIILFRTANGGIIRFPSAILETVAAALFFAWFYRLVQKDYPHELLYPLYMVWYGVQRYIADWLRGNPDEIKPYFMWIPAGRVFSIIIFVIGIAAMYIVAAKMLGRKPTGKEFCRYLLGRTENDNASSAKSSARKKKK